MTKIRRFRADYVKTSDGIGIGIVEYDARWSQDTLAIHTLYIAENWSNREIVVAIFRLINNDLADNELAILQTGKYTWRKGWHKPYTRILYQHQEYFRGLLFECRLLAEDALNRKTDISEQFDEPIYFSIVGQKQEGNDNY